MYTLLNGTLKRTVRDSLVEQIPIELMGIGPSQSTGRERGALSVLEARRLKVALADLSCEPGPLASCSL